MAATLTNNPALTVASTLPVEWEGAVLYWHGEVRQPGLPRRRSTSAIARSVKSKGLSIPRRGSSSAATFRISSTFLQPDFSSTPNWATHQIQFARIRDW